MSLALAVIFTAVICFGAVFAATLLWPGKVIRACIWAERLGDRTAPAPSSTPDVPSGRHARSAPLLSPGVAASPGAARAAVPDPLTHPGRPLDEAPRRPWVLDVDEPPTGPQLAGLVTLATASDRQRAPWPDVDEPSGWPAFATCADLEPIIDGPAPARPFLDRPGLWTEAHR